jgi:hypothetical protein
MVNELQAPSKASAPMSMDQQSGFRPLPSSPPRPSGFPLYGAPHYCYAQNESPPICASESASAFSLLKTPVTVRGPCSPPESFASVSHIRQPMSGEIGTHRSLFMNATAGPHSVGTMPQSRESQHSSFSLPLGPSTCSATMSPLLTQQQPPASYVPPFAMSHGSQSSGSPQFFDANKHQIVSSLTKSVDATAAVVTDSRFRRLQIIVLVLVFLLGATIFQLHRQYIEISRLEHENQLLTSNQEVVKQKCTVSLDSLRQEMQAKFDAASATSNRIHQLELDK